MVNLGITREKNQLDKLFLEAEKRDIQIIPLPLTTITPLINSENDIPNLTEVDWLFFTSAHGVKTFFNNCAMIPDNIKIASVGDKTSEAIISYGLTVSFQPTEAYGKNLYFEFIEKYKYDSHKILFVRAEKINFEPKEFFTGTNISYNEIIAYKTEEKLLHQDSISNLSSEDFILFTAPSSVTAYKNQFGTPKAKLLAIGRSTQKAIEENNWTTYKVLDKPEIDKVLEYI